MVGVEVKGETIRGARTRRMTIYYCTEGCMKKSLPPREELSVLGILYYACEHADLLSKHVYVVESTLLACCASSKNAAVSL